MGRRFWIILAIIAAYFGFKYWRLQQENKNQKKSNNLEGEQPMQKINWDAEEIDFEEIKDQEE